MTEANGHALRSSLISQFSFYELQGICYGQGTHSILHQLEHRETAPLLSTTSNETFLAKALASYIYIWWGFLSEGKVHTLGKIWQSVFEWAIVEMTIIPNL